MPNAKYRAGETLAYAVRDDLEAEGYYVIKSGGSRGIADLIAVKKSAAGYGPHVVMVQAKKAGRLTPADRKELYETAIDRDCTPLYATWHKSGKAKRTVRYYQLLLPEQPVLWTADYGTDWSGVVKGETT